MEILQSPRSLAVLAGMKNNDHAELTMSNEKLISKKQHVLLYWFMFIK